jgi:hypothetical protein
MPRMKLTDEEFNPAELDVEYDNDQATFKRYDGEIPKTGTILKERITKAWWTSSADGDSMIKLLVVAEGNTGDKKQFNDLPTWESLTFKPTAAFRYMPFLEHFGITLNDIKKKMIVADEDDNIGTPIESIAGWEPGSDDARCRIVIKRDRWDGQWQSKVDNEGWLPWDERDEVDDDDDDEPEDEAPPARTRRATATKTRSRREPEPEPDDDEEDEDEDVDEDDLEDDEEDDEDDVEEEEAPPARSRRAPARATKAPARTRAGANGGSRARTPAAATRSSSRTSARAGSKDDPPF